MSINKDMYDEIYENFIKKNKVYDKDICDEIHDKYIEDDECDDTNIWSEICEEYMENNDKKIEVNSHKEESKISVNCKLKVGFDTKNKMIYLYPGKSEYFTVDVSKCCGDITIKCKGCNGKKETCGNLAEYKIVQSGIVAEAYAKFDPRKKDFLYFTAIDECTNECYDFVVVFSSNLCECCY